MHIAQQIIVQQLYICCSIIFALRGSLLNLNPVYTIHPVVKAVEQPVEQPAASSKQTFKRLFNWFDNRLYRVNGVLVLILF